MKFDILIYKNKSNADDVYKMGIIRHWWREATADDISTIVEYGNGSTDIIRMTPDEFLNLEKREFETPSKV